MVATQGYRLGVDLPYIIRVIHYGIPSDRPRYVQDVGRCNRKLALT